MHVILVCPRTHTNVTYKIDVLATLVIFQEPHHSLGHFIAHTYVMFPLYKYNFKNKGIPQLDISLYYRVGLNS